MKKVPGYLSITLLLFISLVLFACATLTKDTTGVYQNKKYNFTVKYDNSWIDLPKNALGQMLLKGDPATKNASFAVQINDIFAPTLKDVPKKLPNYMKNVYPTTTGHKVVYEKMITLKDGTPALELEMEWVIGKNSVTSVMAGVYKGKKIISIWSNCARNDSACLKERRKYTHSLEFKK